MFLSLSQNENGKNNNILQIVSCPWWTPYLEPALCVTLGISNETWWGMWWQKVDFICNYISIYIYILKLHKYIYIYRAHCIQATLFAAVEQHKHQPAVMFPWNTWSKFAACPAIPTLLEICTTKKETNARSPGTNREVYIYIIHATACIYVMVFPFSSTKVGDKPEKHYKKYRLGTLLKAGIASPSAVHLAAFSAGVQIPTRQQVAGMIWS